MDMEVVSSEDEPEVIPQHELSLQERLSNLAGMPLPPGPPPSMAPPSHHEPGFNQEPGPGFNHEPGPGFNHEPGPGFNQQPQAIC